MSPPLEDAITILLVEPNPGDARLFSESFEDANIASDIHTVTDGESALDFVHQRNDHADSPRPDMILLDFQLPDVDGADVLSEFKSEPALQSIPVIVMTSSASEEDISFVRLPRERVRPETGRSGRVRRTRPLVRGLLANVRPLSQLSVVGTRGRLDPTTRATPERR